MFDRSFRLTILFPVNAPPFDRLPTWQSNAFVIARRFENTPGKKAVELIEFPMAAHAVVGARFLTADFTDFTDHPKRNPRCC
ncbi:MAG: hypothetical protein DME26_12715 [Verrucomicrobia bacterium]|nr:MAG: hypothetical protein DME26_12715 [Verrucomicrobiota bacterium]